MYYFKGEDNSYHISKFIYMRFYLLFFLLLLTSCKPTVNKVFPFGIKENGVRAQLKIPIIEDVMIDKMEYIRYAGNRWELKNMYPEEVGIPQHVIKVVTLSKCDTCVERLEMDAFRKKEKEGKYVQLNIDTKIHSRNSASRTGKVFVYNDTTYSSYIKLDETGIDSVCKSWGLTALIKGVMKNETH